MRTCPNCHEDQPDDYFILDDAGVVCDTCAQTTGLRTPAGLKTCGRCDERKPITAFRPHRTWCVECENHERAFKRRLQRRNKSWYFRNGDHRDCPRCGRIMQSCRCPPPPPPTGKVCPGCKTDLVLAAFGPDKHTKDGLRVYCRQCRADQERERRAANARRMGHPAVASGSDGDTRSTEPFA